MDLKDRILIFSGTIVIGVAFIVFGLSLLQDEDLLYQRVGLLLLPGGVLTIAVSARWHLEPLLKSVVLDWRLKLVLLSAAAATLLGYGSITFSTQFLPLSIWSVVGGFVALFVGLGALNAFLRTLITGKRAPSPENLEKFQREMLRASLRPLGVTVLSVLNLFSGLASIIVVVIGAIIPLALTKPSAVYSLPPTPLLSFLLSSLLLFLVGVLSLLLGVGFANGYGWSWSLAVFLTGLSILASGVAVTLGSVQTGVRENVLVIEIPVLALNILTLYYFTRPHVKKFFGKTPSREVILSAP